MYSAQSYWRYESRQSEILSISRWLRNVDQTQVITFLDQLKTELQLTSIGEMTAAFVLKNQSMLSNQSIKNLINSISNSSLHSNTNTNTSNQNTSNHLHNDQIAELSQNQTTIANDDSSNTPKNPLLLLSNDIFDCLGPYLCTSNVQSLGNCNYVLYRITQRRSFLMTAGDRCLRLTRQHIQRIHDFEIDLWQNALGCIDLDLVDSYTNISDYGVKDFIHAIKIMPNYTNWIEILFQHVHYIYLDGDCTLFSELIPIKTLFSIEQYNDNTNQIDYIERYPLTLRFGDLGRSIMDLQRVFEKYNRFFVNNCHSNLDHIRQIKCLEFRFKYGHSEETLREVSQMLHLVKPNYSEIHARQDITFQSFNDILNLFHPKLTTFRTQSIDILMVETEIMAELHFRALENGLIFSLTDIIGNHFANDIDDETETDSDQNDEHQLKLTGDEVSFIYRQFGRRSRRNVLTNRLRVNNETFGRDLRNNDQM